MSRDRSIRARDQTASSLGLTDTATATARGLGLRALAWARLATVAAGVTLAAGSADASVWAIVVVSAAAVVWALASGAYLLRGAASPTARGVIATVDFVALAVGFAATGGADSDLRFLLGVLPLAVGFAFGRWSVAATGTAMVAVLVIVDGASDAVLATDGVVLIWSTTVGLVLAHDRAAILARIAHVAAARERLLHAFSSAGARERDRAAEELRAGALSDVQRARYLLANGWDADQIVEACRAIGARVRGLVSELHALSAKPTDLGGAVRQLAQRRAGTTGERTVAVAVDPRAAGRRDDLVLSLVRDLLDAVAAHRWARLALEVRGGDGRLDIEVRCEGPDAVLDSLAVAAIEERISLVPGSRMEVTGTGATVVLPDAPDRDAGLPPVPATIQTLLVARAAGAVAMLGVARIAGADDATFWVLGGLGVAVAAISSPPWGRPRQSARATALVTVADQAWILLLLANAGAGTDAVRMVLIGFVPVYSCRYGPRAVLAFGTALGTGALVVAGFAMAFVVAYAWSMVVALLLADASVRASRMVEAELEGRRVALRSLLTSEEAARRTVARRLHDDALQILLAAGQDAEEAAQGGPDAQLARSRASLALALAADVLSISGLVGESDPAPPGGLVAGLAALALSTERSTGVRVRSSLDERVDDAISDQDAGLLHGLARELLANAAQHAHATEIELAITRAEDGGVALRVADDGRGIAPGRVAAAVAEGHVGLAAARDRVERRGGRMLVTPGRGGRGTEIVATVPAEVALSGASSSP